MVKRALDVTLGLVGCIVFAPFMALIAILVWMTMGAPVIFSQDRLGLNGRSLRARKFRSMTIEHDAHGHLLSDEVRTTRLGAVLRRTRLDELPTFYDVLVGRLSMVGPRPLPAPSYSQGLDTRRLAVKPGFTGLAQVSGNTQLSNSEKFALDMLYIDETRLSLDLRIILMTLVTVVRGERRNEALIGRAETKMGLLP